jgi:tetratricopeptide (TPR) repeat protein
VTLGWAEAHNYDEKLLDQLPELEQQIQEDPKDPQTYERLIVILWDLGKYAEALRWADHLTKELPESPMGYYHTAASLFLMKRSQEALTPVAQAVRLAKKARWCTKLKHLIKMDLRQSQNPASERERLLFLHWLRLDRDDSLERSYLDEAVPWQVDFLLNEVDILWEMGRFEDAREKIVDALLHDPTHAQAKSDYAGIVQADAPMYGFYTRALQYYYWIWLAMTVALIFFYLNFQWVPAFIYLILPLIGQFYSMWMDTQPAGFLLQASEKRRRNIRAIKVLLLGILAIFALAMMFEKLLS